MKLAVKKFITNIGEKHWWKQGSQIRESTN